MATVEFNLLCAIEGHSVDEIRSSDMPSVVRRVRSA
jgi:hypothetical protein